MNATNNQITLVKDTINNNDIDNLISWLETYPKLTKGEKTIEFEEMWSKWMGCKYSVFVNSGSSANLLMFYALKELYKLRNNKIAIPALSWATDLSPAIHLGFEPILVDCNLDNLSVDLKHLEELFKEEAPSALVLVSVLGLAPEIDKIVSLCKKYDVILLEDNCESQGTSVNELKLGNFGLMSSFSTYFGHTMSTIEGGMVCTNDKAVYNMIKQLRSHGWDRDLDVETQRKLRNDWNVDSFSSLYTFYVPGFNLRSTDLQAVIGIGQLKKIDDMISKRNENFKKFSDLLKGHTWFPKETDNSFTSSFCIPIIAVSSEQKKRIVDKLINNGVECRPLICGSMGTQPFYVKKYGRKELPNASIVDSCGLYVPNHPNLTDEEIERICNCILTSLIK
jgi:CDP-6-deoxy-D-xylo-4-hexulose-3-dehydrase